jgi:hypothetical protein
VNWKSGTFQSFTQNRKNVVPGNQFLSPIKKRVEDDTTVQKIERDYLFSSQTSLSLYNAGRNAIPSFKFPPGGGVRLPVCETQGGV